MTAPLDAALARYAAPLLIGTGLDAAAAQTLAADPDRPISPEAAAAVAALRDGWAVAARPVPLPTGSPAAVVEDQP